MISLSINVLLSHSPRVFLFNVVFVRGNAGMVSLLDAGDSRHVDCVQGLNKLCQKTL